jgi:flagellar biosynthesis chaperone FliJ
MEVLRNEIDGIKSILSELSKEVDKLIISTENTSSERLKFLTTLAQRKRNELLNKYPLYELQKYNDELSVSVKLVNRKLDELHKQRKKSVKEIAKELKSVQNKKKIAAYGK